MNDFWQAIDEARQRIQPKPEDTAVIIVHPSMVARIQQAQQDAPRLSRFSGVEIETDAEVDPAVVCIVTHAQLEAYKRARQWATPWRAVNAAARIEEYRQAAPPPAYQHTWAAEPAEPVKPHAVRQPRRRFPIPR